MSSSCHVMDSRRSRIFKIEMLPFKKVLCILSSIVVVAFKKEKN